MQSRYELIIYWSDDDQCFIVEVPELQGCMADGSTYQEAVKNVEVIIQEWIETARQLGRPIPEPAAGGAPAAGGEPRAGSDHTNQLKYLDNLFMKPPKHPLYRRFRRLKKQYKRSTSGMRFGVDLR